MVHKYIIMYSGYLASRGRLDKVNDFGVDCKQCGTGYSRVHRASEGFELKRDSQRNSNGGVIELNHDSVEAGWIRSTISV
jgi:hypothetical protein